jgi:hypothetical protein
MSKPVNRLWLAHHQLEDLAVRSPRPVKNAILLVLVRERVQNRLIELRTAQIDVLDPDLKKLQERSRAQRQRIMQRLQQQGGGAPGTGGKQDLQIPPPE